ncbi:VCBS repeat-containing protein [Streptomyces sp. NPDC048411]|uniref:FG-GAP repeat domain-containing protein n=1 Tax=Streptomyces sp. NPDC048411 TaxID=3157206 RepID=UPI003457315F
MAKTSGRKHRRIAARAAAAALTAALVGTGTSAVAADAPSAQPSLGADTAQPSAAAADAAATTPVFALYGIDSTGTAYSYTPTGTGGLTARDNAGNGWKTVNSVLQVDNGADGDADGIWSREGSTLYYQNFDVTTQTKVGTGWNIYNKLVSPGNLGGAGAGDLLGRDSSGNLYLYLNYGNGKLTSRYKVGSGWDIYTQIAGNGDLTGDGKNDLVARDKAGVLWLYKGTGNYKAPFATRTRIGAGWNTYNYLISSGDLNLDGKTDLIARDTTGALWSYQGTGNAAAPFKAKVRIGTSGWNTYRLLF